MDSDFKKTLDFPNASRRTYRTIISIAPTRMSSKNSGQNRLKSHSTGSSDSDGAELPQFSHAASVSKTAAPIAALNRASNIDIPVIASSNLLPSAELKRKRAKLPKAPTKPSIRNAAPKVIYLAIV